MSRSIRFMLFPKGEEILKEFSPSNTFEQVAVSLFNDWPNNYPVVQSVDQIQLIFAGKKLLGSQTLEEVLRLSEQSERPTVHIFVRKAKSEATPAPVASEPAVRRASIPIPVSLPESEEGLDVPVDWHLHGCAFNEEEASQMIQIFQKKKKADGLMRLTDLNSFLRTYWRWMAVNKHHDQNLPFPFDDLEAIKVEVKIVEDKIDLDQFLSIFFLFDNVTPKERCHHGECARVRRATEELHKSLVDDEAAFNESIFNTLFQQIDSDADGVLSCRQLELLYYLYAVHVTCISDLSSSRSSNVPEAPIVQATSV